MELKVLVFNDEVIATRFTRMGNAMVNTEPAMNEAATYLMSRAEGKFQSQGRSGGGGSWKRLKPKWLNFKIRHGFSPLILVKEGKLRTSVTKRDAPGQVLDISRFTLRFGSNLEYAATQQFGDKSRGIPARPFLSTNRRDGQNLRNILRNHIMKEWPGGAV